MIIKESLVSNGLMCVRQYWYCGQRAVRRGSNMTYVCFPPAFFFFSYLSIKPSASERNDVGQTAEEGNAMAAIADKPVDVANFVKHCDQRRKYPVLLRVEFQVTSFYSKQHRRVRRCITSFHVFNVNSFCFVLFFYRRRAKWRVIRLGMDPSRKTDQKIKTKKSFPVSRFM